MSADERERLRKQFGHLNRPELTDRIRRNVGYDVSEARLWLEILDDEERKEAIERAIESANIAHRAARASERAAEASENSAKWTRAAAFASAIAAIAAAVTAAWPWIATVWNLPGAPK